MNALHLAPTSRPGCRPAEADTVPIDRTAAGSYDGGSGNGRRPSESQRPLRVAHITDFYLPRVGGIELHVAGLAEAQRRAGHEVDVISSGGVVDDSAPSRVALRTRTSFFPRNVRAATDALLEGSYDIVHAHAGLATPLTFAATRAACRVGLPTTVTLHSMIGGLAAAYRAVDVAATWRSWPVGWSAVSEAAAAPLRELLGTGAVVDVLPNAIDVDAWRPAPRSPRRDGELVVVSVMRLAARKRPLAFLRLLRDAERALAPQRCLRVVIVGDGPQRPAAERFVRRHHMDWVQLVGLQDHATIRSLFCAADVFVAPARKESFGIAALEARTSGLPVLAMACAGVGEFLEAGAGGLLVEDDRAMAAALVELAEHPMAVAEMTVHNRLVRPPFSWTDALQRTDAVYARAIRMHRPTAEAGSRLGCRAAAVPAQLQTSAR